MRQRDSQRSRVYKAENAVFDMHAGVLNQEEVLAVRNKILSSRHWRKAKGSKWVLLRFKRSTYQRALFHHKDKSISLPPWAMNKHVVIHEMAHSLTFKEDKTLPGHGKIFCSHYLNLVAELLGEGEAERLEISFWEHEVRY